MRTTEAVRAAMSYVVMNPVVGGMVEKAEDYLYLAWDATWLV